MNAKAETPGDVRARTENYAAYRDRIQDGDVLCFSGAHWLSGFIRRLSHGRYSHGGIAFWWDERLMVLQAEAGPGVQALPASRAIAKYNGNVDWYAVRPEHRSGEFVTKLTEAAMERLGDPYSIPDLIRIGLHYAIGTPLPPEPSARTGHRFVCSQYVAYCFSAADLDLAPTRPDIGTTPEDLSRSPYLGDPVRLKG